MRETLAKSGAGKVVCRLCKGAHFTAKCPYKESLAGLDAAGAIYCHHVSLSSLTLGPGDVPPEDDADVPAPAAAPSSGPSKYIPPSMRAGARTAGDSMNRTGSRDDLPTLRVTNISEDTQESDLRDLFGVFGRVVRVYVGRDRETGIGKGFAFVSFEDKAVALKAIEKMNGRGYDSLILNVQWSRKCKIYPQTQCTRSRKSSSTEPREQR